MCEAWVIDLGRVGVNTPPVTTGAEIKRARELAGLTQAQLADALNVSSNTVSNWERGHSQPRGREPQLRRLLRMDELESERSAEPRGTLLHEASHVELLAELARRIASSQEPGRELPPVPQVRLSWPRSAAPSARRESDNPDAERNTPS